MPAFGHTTHLRLFIDPDLLQYDEVWAAAGTWHDVFGIEPHKLVETSPGPQTSAGFDGRLWHVRVSRSRRG